MNSKGILNRMQRWWDAVGHLGRLGRTASNRSFLRRERRKLYQKLGEAAFHWSKGHKSPPAEFSRLVGQVDKIDSLLAKMDYGGEAGADFHSAPRKKKSPK